MKTFLHAWLGLFLFIATQHALAQNRQAIVTGGDVPTPAGGAVIVTGGAQPIPNPNATTAITNQNRLGSVAGQGSAGVSGNVTTSVINSYSAPTNSAAVTNSQLGVPVPPNAGRNLLQPKSR